MQSSPFAFAPAGSRSSLKVGASCFCPFSFQPGSAALSRVAGSFTPKQETRP